MTDEEAVELLFQHVKQGTRETIEAYRERVSSMFDAIAQVQDAIKEVNKEYFIVKGPINDGVIHKVGKDAKGRTLVRPVKRENFSASWANKKVKYTDEKGDEQQITYSKLWLSAPQRNERLGVVFDPSARTPTTYVNLWQDWKYKPRPGKWDLYQDLIRYGIAAGEQELFDYILNWMSHIIKKPTEGMDVALCITGTEGIGKSVFGEHFGALFGQHYVQLETLARVVAQFNGFVKDKLLVQVDEAYVSNARNDALRGVLNGLIDGNEILVEHKGFETEQYTNYLHFVMTSNNKVFVPAGTRGRRFTVLEASSRYYENFDFFRAMEKQMENGGYEALMYELKERDISEFEPRRVPRTQARADQVLANIDSVEAWLRSLLRSGEWPLYVRVWNTGRSWLESEYIVPAEDAYEEYKKYWIDNTEMFRQAGKHRVMPDDFGKRLSELVSTVEYRNRTYSRRTRNNTEHFRVDRLGGHVQCYHFPKWGEMVQELANRRGVEPEQYLN